MNILKVANSFLGQMQARLIQKMAAEGFEGWEMWPKHHLIRRLQTKAKKVSMTTGSERRKHLVDIANFAMMIHYQEEAEE